MTSWRQWPWRVLVIAGLVGLLVDFDGSVLYLALPAIASDFRAPVAELSQAFSILALGNALSLPLGALADRRGRKPALAITVAGFAAGNVASGLAPSLLVFAGFRLAAVAFAAAAFTLALTLVVEAAPADRRSLLVNAISLGGGAGAGVTALIYPLLAPHWRYLYLLGGLGLLVAVVVLLWLPESRVWQESGHADHPSRVLLRGPWRGRLAVFAAASALVWVAYYPGGVFGALFASRSLGFRPLLISAVLVSAAPLTVLGYVAGGWIGDRHGRRLPGGGFSALSAIFAGVTFSGGAAAFWGGNLAWAFFDGCASPVIAAWVSELFPTRARATAQTAGVVAAAIGGIAGLQLLGLGSPRYGLGPTLVGLSLAALAGALLLLLLPETRGTKLPD